MWKKIKELLFRNTTIRQTVAKNTFWSAVSNVGGRLLRAIIIIYGARVLGSDEYGAFSYAVSLIAFLTLFIDIGIGPILIRETAKTKDERRRSQILSTAFFMKIALLAIFITLAVILAPYLAKDERIKSLIPIVVFIMAFDTIREFFGTALMRALEKMEWEAAFFLATNAAIVIFGFIFLYFSKTAAAFAYSYAIGAGLGMAFAIFKLRNYLKSIFSNFSAKLIGFIFSSAWPFAISGALAILLTNTDILLIGWIKTTSDVGLYSAILRIVQFLYILPAILTVGILPQLSKLATRDDNKFRIILEKIISLSFLAAIPMALGGFVLGEKIVDFVFGAEYLPAASSYRILMLTLLVDFPAVLLANAMFAYNRQKNLILYSAIGGSFNIVFDLLLIPRFGIIGSAWATLGAQAISNAYLWYAVKKINYFTILPYLKKIIFATLVMAVFALALSGIGMNVLLVIAASALLYFGLLAAFREPLLGEMKLILRPAASAAPENNAEAA